MQDDQLYLATANWCGHCTHQKNELKAAVASNNLPASAVEIVECEPANGVTLSASHQAVCKKATAFPTWVRNGETVAEGAGKTVKDVCSMAPGKCNN